MNTITIPSNLKGFVNTETRIGRTASERDIYLIDGIMDGGEAPACSKCGCRMHIHGIVDASLSHIPIGAAFSAARFEKKR